MSCLSLGKADWPRYITRKILGTVALSAALSVAFAQTSLGQPVPDHSLEPAHFETQGLETPSLDTPSLDTPSLDTQSLDTLVSHLDTLRAEVENHQQSLGAYNQELLGSLNALTEALISAEAWTEAAAAVEQQIQILRINDGLYTDSQIPLIEQQLGILAARHDWASLEDRLIYLALLIERDEQMPVETRLLHLKQIRDWSRLLLTRGPRILEARYLLQLQSHEEAALKLAASSIDDPELKQSLIYDRAVAELYIALGIMGSSDTRNQLINRIEGPESTMMRRSQTMLTVSDIEGVYGPSTTTAIERAHRAAMARHQEIITSLATAGSDGQHADAREALLAMEQSDPEQAGIIKLFIGDSILMRQQYEMRLGSNVGPSRGTGSTGLAARFYQDAWDLLLAAGHDAGELNRYFSCPAILPLNHFSKRLATLPQSCVFSDSTTVSIGDVAVVRGSIPGLRYEKLPDSDLISDSEGIKASLSFNIGVNGQADRITINASTPDRTSSRIRGKEALQALQFRPVLRDGRPVRATSVTMNLYSLVSD